MLNGNKPHYLNRLLLFFSLVIKVNDAFLIIIGPVPMARKNPAYDL